VARQLASASALAALLLPPGQSLAWVVFAGDSLLRLQFDLLRELVGAAGWPPDAPTFYCQGQRHAVDGALHALHCRPGAPALEDARSELQGLHAALRPGQVLLAFTCAFVTAPLALPAFPPLYPEPHALGVAGFAAWHLLPPPGACAASANATCWLAPTAMVINPGLHPLVRNLTARDFGLQLRGMYQELWGGSLRGSTARPRLVQHLLLPVDNGKLPAGSWKALVFTDANIRAFNAEAVRALAWAQAQLPAQQWPLEVVDGYALVAGGGGAWGAGASGDSEAPWTQTADGWHFDDEYNRLALWVDLHLAAGRGSFVFGKGTGFGLGVRLPRSDSIADQLT
jgi:hypothetical protein